MFVFVYEVCVKFANINNITMQMIVNSTINFITVICLCNKENILFAR